MQIVVKYKDIVGKDERLEKIEKGDHIDVRCFGASKIEHIRTVTEENGIKKLKRDKVVTPLEPSIGIDENGNEVQFIQYKKGDFLMLDLGMAVKLPKGFEMHVVPRSSSFKNYGFIQTNGVGIIDESYCGDDDYIFEPAYMLEDGFIIIGERIAQFKIVQKMPTLKFKEVNKLSSENRGGNGSTGTK